MFADLLPTENDEAYSEVIEHAIQQYEKDVAIQYAIHNTVPFFRRMCQCPSCGRIFIEDESYRAYEFLPADPEVPKDLLSSRVRSEDRSS
jgi:hypothetical protein